MKTCFLTEKGPKAVGPYSTAVTAGGMIYLSGVVPIDPATGKAVDGGIEAETAQVVETLKVIASELGRSLADAVKVTVYLTDMSDFAKVNALYQAAFGPQYPARTCVAVAGLPLGVHIEVEVILQA